MTKASDEEPSWGMLSTHKIRTKGQEKTVDPSKVFNKATNSWVDKHAFSLALQPDLRSPNINETKKNQKKLT